MNSKNTPVVVSIQKKEAELKGKVLEAKGKAESLVAAARKEASKLCQDARLEQEKKAKSLLAEGLTKANAEAQKILKTTEKAISSLAPKSKKNFNQAVNLILLAVSGYPLAREDIEGDIDIPMIDTTIGSNYPATEGIKSNYKKGPVVLSTNRETKNIADVDTGGEENAY